MCALLIAALAAASPQAFDPAVHFGSQAAFEVEVTQATDKGVSGPVTFVLKWPEKSALGGPPSKAAILIKEGEKFEVGRRYVFFVNEQSAGTEITWSEVAHTDDTGGALSELAALESTDDHQLRELLSQMPLVVVGRVAEVAGGPVARGRSEHDPMWTDATIALEGSLKGALPERSKRARLDVQFAASMDIAAYHLPKLKPGQEGIFLIAPEQNAHTPHDQVKAFFPISELHRVGRLLR